MMHRAVLETVRKSAAPVQCGMPQPGLSRDVNATLLPLWHAAARRMLFPGTWQPSRPRVQLQAAAQPPMLSCCSKHSSSSTLSTCWLPSSTGLQRSAWRPNMHPQQLLHRARLWWFKTAGGTSRDQHHQQPSMPGCCSRHMSSVVSGLRATGSCWGKQPSERCSRCSWRWRSCRPRGGPMPFWRENMWR